MVPVLIVSAPNLFWSFFGTKSSAFYFCTAVLVFGPILVPKTVHFTFLQPVLFGVHFTANCGNLLLATSFGYPLLIGALKNCFICYFALAANLQHYPKWTPTACN